MAITYTVYSATRDNSAGLFTVVSPSLTLAANDVIVVIFIADDNDAPANITISNSGSALTWNSIASTNTTGNCKVVAWWALSPDSTARTVTVTHDNTTSTTRRLHCIVHTGAHTTNPVPAGKVSSGVGGADVSQAITPTASGSALWMGAGDWNATNSFAAASNCTLADNFHDAGQFTAALIRPTTQPRTDANAFTIGETDTNGKIAWLAFEVQAAASSQSQAPRSVYHMRQQGMS
jgi:hypothetical protein